MTVLKQELDCLLLSHQIINDNRGWFKVAFNIADFQPFSFEKVCQINHSMTERAGTVRGLNYQAAPFEQAKIVRCIKGSLYSVAVDIRIDSQNYGKWCGFELDAANNCLMYVPRGYAHGFITNEDATELEYITDNVYSREHAKSIRYDDPDLDIDWTQNGRIAILSDIQSEKNKNAPSLSKMLEEESI